MIARSALSLALAALALAGCALGPDYIRPESTLPAAYAEAPATEQADPDILPTWWAHFQDPLLDRLVGQALARNADVRTAVARVEEAEALAREAGAALFPQIDLDVASSRSRVSAMTATPMPAGTPQLRNARSAALVTSYEIDVWGRVRRANEAVRSQALASRYGQDAVRLTVAGLVANSYLALRAYDAQLAVTRDSLLSREDSLKLVRARVEAGLVSPLDQHQAESELAATQARAAELRRLRALTLHQLALLVAEPNLAIEPGQLESLPLPPVPPAGLPSSLVQGRPDIRQAEENLAAATATIGVARAGYFPRFNLTGSLGSQSKTLSDLFSAGATTWSLGLGLLVPVLDFGRTSARVDQAGARAKQSLAAYQDALQTAFKEVNDALAGLRENAIGEEAQAARVEASGKALELARLRYEAGYSGYLEVLDAQRSHNDARLSLVATRQARLAAAVDLFKALGGGWKDAYPPFAAAD